MRIHTPSSLHKELLSVLIQRYTAEGYLPNPSVNYPPPIRDKRGYSRRESLDIDSVPQCLSEGIAQNFQFVGRLIGRALFDGIPLGIRLNPLMYELLSTQEMLFCGRALPVTEDDIQHINTELSRGIRQIKTLVDEAGDANDYDLYFSVDISNSVDGSPHYEEIDLIPDGRNRRVSSENVDQYSELMIKHALYDDYRNSLSFLLKGLFEVIPQEYLAIFSEQELKLILEGEPIIDVDDWRRNTVYTNEFFDQHPSVIAFWSILKRWNTQQQSLLLRFATGYCNPPILGFSHLKGPDGRTMPFCLSPLPYNIRTLPDDNIMQFQLRAHTCFHKLEIPVVAESVLEKVMLATIQSDKGCYGFDEE